MVGSITLTLIQFVLALGLLLFAADRLVYGASRIATYFGLSPLFVGLTIIAIGTSAPEIVISITASMREAPELGIGNAIGSNIANLSLVLGLCAMVQPIDVSKSLMKVELPILLFISLTVSVLFLNRTFSAIDSLICLILFLTFLVYCFYQAIKKNIIKKPHEIHYQQNTKPQNPPPISKKSLLIALFWTGFGLIILPLSSDSFVSSAQSIATWFGLSDMVIGLTIVALGTSLPELATGLMSSLKKQSGLTLGNIIGSNIFNLTAVLAPIGFIHSISIPKMVIYRDLSTMLLLTIVLIMCALLSITKRYAKIYGAVLILFYIGYTGFLAGS